MLQWPSACTESVSWPLWAPTAAFQRSAPVSAFMAQTIHSLPPPITAGVPFTWAAIGDACMPWS